MVKLEYWVTFLIFFSLILISNTFRFKIIKEQVFEQTHYPDSAIREQLSLSLNLSISRIQIWFQNRRAKFRKMDMINRNSNNMSSKKLMKITKKGIDELFNYNLLF